MRVFMADMLLHGARELMGECGYHRRAEELADAEEAAKGW